MTPLRRGKPLREGGRPHESTILDLLLDLVFVFVLNRIAAQAIHDLTEAPHIVLPHVGETLMLFLAVWLVWYYTALAAGTFDPRRTGIELLVFWAAFSSVVMGVSVPEAFEGQAVVFVGAYVSIQVGRPLVLTLLKRGQGQPPIPERMLVWSSVSAVPWIVGALVPNDTARDVLWVIALVLDYGGFGAGWPTPKFGRATVEEWEVIGEYLADRYRQFFVIVLGESVLLSGLTFSDTHPHEIGSTAAFVLAFSTTALLWRIYFYRAGSVLKDAIRLAKQPIFLVAHGFIAHHLMALGIIVAAVGYGLTILHPYAAGHVVWTCAVLGGPAVFLCGRARFEYDVFARVSRPRLTSAAALIVLIPLTVRLPLLAVAGIATAFLLGIAIADALRARADPEETPKPPH